MLSLLPQIQIIALHPKLLQTHQVEVRLRNAGGNLVEALYSELGDLPETPAVEREDGELGGGVGRHGEDVW